MNKVNPFPALTAPCPLTFLSKLSNAEKVALVAKLRGAFLAKGIARFDKAFLLKLLITLPNVSPRNPPD